MTHFTQATTYPAIVGRLLETMRKQKGLDQAQLAAAIGVTQSTWSRVENGTVAVSVEQLSKVARALKSAPGAILDQADTVERVLRMRGIRVETERIDDPIDMGLLLIGAAALSALIILILASKKG
jgi:transcriptional regulator with XRE-family HTH domain